MKPRELSSLDLSLMSRQLALIVDSDLSLQEGIGLVRQQTKTRAIKQFLSRLEDRLNEGCSVGKAFGQEKDVLPDYYIKMINIGEQSGNLDGALMKVSEYHLAEANQAVKVASTVMGVVMLVGIAALVGALIITFYSRLYGGMLDSIT